MPRARIIGYLAVAVSLACAALFVYFGFVETLLHPGAPAGNAYYAIAVPIGFAALLVLGAGFWIGWTILAIKVVPPMPEIVEKKDYSKIKAFFMCITTLALGVLLIYGIYIRNFWALAIPAAAICIVILGAVFWVGIAIITTRSTLPEEKQQS